MVFHLGLHSFLEFHFPKYRSASVSGRFGRFYAEKNTAGRPKMTLQTSPDRFHIDFIHCSWDQ